MAQGRDCIIGIDPGSRRTGFGIVARQAGGFVYVASGCIRLPQAAHPERLAHLFHAIKALLHDYNPEVLVLEQAFVGISAASALKLGQARGVVMCAAALQRVEFAEYSPASIKQAVTGGGRADKAQVQKMVQHWLHLPATPAEDAADALAAAICHMIQSPLTAIVGLRKSS